MGGGASEPASGCEQDQAVTRPLGRGWGCPRVSPGGRQKRQVASGVKVSRSRLPDWDAPAAGVPLSVRALLSLSQQQTDFWQAQAYLTSQLVCSRCDQVIKFWSF